MVQTKSKVIIFFVGLLLCGCVTSKRTAFLNNDINSKPDTKEYNLEDYYEKYNNYDAVYLLKDIVYDQFGEKEKGVFGNKWNMIKVERFKYLIINPKNDNYTTYKLDVFPTATVEKLIAHISYPDGSNKVFNKLNFKKLEDPNGFESYNLIIPNVEKGTIVDIGYEMNYKMFSYPILDYSIPLQFIIPAEKLSFQYSYPAWWEINVKQLGPDKKIEYVSEYLVKDKKKKLIYTDTMVPPIIIEPYSPYFREMANYIDFEVTKFRMGGVSFNSPENWNKVMEEIRKSYMNKKGRSENVENYSKALTKGLTNEKDKIKAIINYVQENIIVSNEYSGNNFTEILEERKGSAAKITGLVHSMLESVGVESIYLLLHSASDGYFDKNYISYDQFTAPAVCVQSTDRTYVLFPYIKIPVGLIPNEFRDQVGLGISGQKDDKKAVFIDIPDNSEYEAEDQITHDININILQEGSIKVNEVISFEGYEGFDMRTTIEDYKDDELREYATKELFSSELNIQLDSIYIINREKIDSALKISLDYTVENNVVFAGEEIIVKSKDILSSASVELSIKSFGERKNPIRIYNDSKTIKNIKISYPDNWIPDINNLNSSVSNNFGYSKSESQVLNGELYINQVLFLNETEADKNQIQSLVDLIGEDSKLNIDNIIFSRNID